MEGIFPKAPKQAWPLPFPTHFFYVPKKRGFTVPLQRRPLPSKKQKEQTVHRPGIEPGASRIEPLGHGNG